MATQTDKLKIRLIQPSEDFADDAFNEVIKDIDNKVVGVSHLTSGEHWSVWEKSTDYVVGDVVRTPYLKSNQYMECVVAGTSSTTSPTNNMQGSNVTDNTVTWTIKTLGGASDSTVSFWKSNAQYYKGSLVVYNNKLYRSYFTHISSTFSNDKANWFEVQSSINIWTASAYYAAGDTVVYEGNVYQCNTGNTDATFTVANWNLLNSYGIVKDWSASTKYFKDQLISYDGAIYKVKSSYTSGNSFSDINLSLVSSTIPTWSSNTYYPVGIIVQNGNVMYKCTSAHTSSNAFNTDLANWEIFHTPNAFVRDWQANTEYKAGQLVVVNGNLYRRTSDGYDTTWSTGFWELVTNSITDWGANTDYTRGQYVNYNGALYKCINYHTAQPAFQNDIGNWQKIYSNLRTWTSNTQYFIDDIVTDGKKIYICLSAHISSNDMIADIASWKSLSSCVIDDFSQNKYYNTHDLIAVSGNLYRCNNGYTSTTDLITDINSWEEISGVNEWSAGQIYIKGNVVLYGNRIYKCNKSHTSTTNFDSDKSIYWVRLDDNPIINDWTSGEQYEAGSVVIVTNINGISKWKENTSYKVGDSVVCNEYVYTCSTANNDTTFIDSNWKLKESVYNRIYRCITSNNGTTFDTSKWQLINGDAEAIPQEVEDLLL